MQHTELSKEKSAKNFRLQSRDNSTKINFTFDPQTDIDLHNISGWNTVHRCYPKATVGICGQSHGSVAGTAIREVRGTCFFSFIRIGLK